VKGRAHPGFIIFIYEFAKPAVVGQFECNATLKGCELTAVGERCDTHGTRSDLIHEVWLSDWYNHRRDWLRVLSPSYENCLTSLRLSAFQIAQPGSLLLKIDH
jgi:hypothetical protein